MKGTKMKNKHSLYRAFSLALSFALLLGCFQTSMAAAIADDATNLVAVAVDAVGKSVTIGNALIQRSFSYTGGKVATGSIVNNRSGITLVPGAGSEDFILNVSNAFTSSADPVTANLIKISDLIFTGDPQVIKLDGGYRIVFSFEPFTKNDVPGTIVYNIVMLDGDNFINSWLEISVPSANYSGAYINSIDMDAFNIGNPADSLLFCRPETITRQYLSDYMTGFGQPLYVNSLFFGVEFPVVDNRITPFPKSANAGSDKTLVMRYYSGKNFTQLKKNAAGQFVTWPAVVGAARTNEYEVVQSDFFDYVHELAQGASFRTNYNTWYDGGMNITPASVTESFMGIEQGLTQAGLPPMDSYVMDDGYNDYSGPFWGFKPAFANNVMKDLSIMMNNAGGAFGLWTSPRGGWGSDQYPFMAAAGTGAGSSAGKTCVADPVYQRNFENYMSTWQDEYNINYWKIDGLAASPCTTGTHGHMVGGTANGQTAANSSVYFFTDLWENFIQVFINAKSHGSNGKDVFYNCTSYSFPSPWFLEYVNTIYLQTSSDSGKAGPTTVGDGARRLTYRDDQYWRFFVNNKFQIPYNYIWNHDPIYALGDSYVAMTDQDLRENLYGNAMRGVAVWEMLFSPSIITEGQWMATKEVLDFAQKNEDVLKFSRLIAPLGQIASGTAETAVNGYIFSAWTENEGFVSFRNPKATTTITLTLTLDRIAGVKEGMKDLTMTYVLPSAIDTGKVQNRKETYSYGDTVTVTLQPQNFVILRFGEKDIAAPQVVRSEAMDNNTLRVFFDEAIELAGAASIAGHTVSDVKLTADFMAVDITVNDAFANNEAIALTSLTVKDLSGNQAAVTGSARHAAGRLISEFKSAADLSGAANVYDDALLQSAVVSLNRNVVSFAGGASADITNKLTVSSLVKTTDSSAAMIEQAGAYSVKLNAEGKVEFSVGLLTVTSQQAINDGAWHHFACIKEPNEMLKIYIDGKINASVYDGRTLNMLSAGSVTIGSAAFTGDLSQIKIYNKSFGWKEVAALAEQPLSDYDLAGFNAYTVAGIAPSLPSTVQTRYDTTNYFRNYAAVWAGVDESKYAAAGNAEISAVLPGFENLAVNGNLSVLPKWPARFSLMGSNLTTVLNDLKANGWEVLNETTSRLAVNTSGLAITAQSSKMDRGAIDPATQTVLPDVVNENFFLIDPGMDDYCASVAVNGRADQMNKSAGLIFRQDDSNFVRMTYRISGNSSNGARTVFSLNVKDKGYEYTLEQAPASNLTTYYLALDKKGDYYTGYYSSNGTAWTKLGTVKASLEAPKSGFYAALGIRNVTNFTSSSFAPRFSNFDIHQYSVGLTISGDTAGTLAIPYESVSPRYAWADTTFSDGSKGSLLVEIPPVATDIPAAVITVQGTIAGETIQVPVTVTIVPPPITSLRIHASATYSVKRGDKLQLEAIVNDGSFPAGLKWSISNPLYATVDDNGNITILNKTGTVILTVTDPTSGQSHSIVLRIT
jgi:regulation of enolase protein 1 (concanavalin A-like superfamily)